MQQRLPGRHAPVLLALLLRAGALGLPLTGTIVGGGRGGRAWLCRQRGAAVGLTVPGLLPDGGTINGARYPWAGPRLGCQLLLLLAFLPLPLFLLFLLLDATVPAGTWVVGLVPALGRRRALVFLVELEMALWSRDQEEHGELGQRDGG